MVIKQAEGDIVTPDFIRSDIRDESINNLIKASIIFEENTFKLSSRFKKNSTWTNNPNFLR